VIAWVLVLGRTYDNQDCSAARALELIGERWSLLIVRDAALRGMTRFAEFQRSLGVASNILNKRLDDFVAAGLMERRPVPGHAGHQEYVLTPRGLELQPIVLALSAWGDRWAAPDGPPVHFEHRDCGGTALQDVHCTTCGDRLAGADVVARPAANTA